MKKWMFLFLLVCTIGMAYAKRMVVLEEFTSGT
jgi:hypothetical protein